MSIDREPGDIFFKKIKQQQARWKAAESAERDKARRKFQELKGLCLEDENFLDDLPEALDAKVSRLEGHIDRALERIKAEYSVQLPESKN